ncbi:ATP synthase subunit epsilon, partial [Candidatus Endoriftia persephone str. Guaymas]|nr:ATP synthase subunit epsilon [Candidatus Endoriftia persephone str. Guaymas]
QLAEDEPLELLLPRDVVGLEQLRKDPEALRASPLTELSGLITKEMLRDGVSFGEADDQHAGIRLSIRDGAIQLDLSDVAVTRLLLAHLQPRFRALVEGIVG